METKIEELPASYRVGPVEYQTDRLKESLASETNTWKQAFGKALAEKVGVDFVSFLRFALFSYSTINNRYFRVAQN